MFHVFLFGLLPFSIWLRGDPSIYYIYIYIYYIHGSFPYSRWMCLHTAEKKSILEAILTSQLLVRKPAMRSPALWCLLWNDLIWPSPHLMDKIKHRQWLSLNPPAMFQILWPGPHPHCQDSTQQVWCWLLGCSPGRHSSVPRNKPGFLKWTYIPGHILLHRNRARTPDSASGPQERDLPRSPSIQTWLNLSNKWNLSPFQTFRGVWSGGLYRLSRIPSIEMDLVPKTTRPTPGLQPPPGSRHLSTIQACALPHPPLPSRVPGQSLHMGFQRLDNEQWRPKFTQVPHSSLLRSQPLMVRVFMS